MLKHLLTTLVFLTACQQVGRPSPPAVPTTNLKEICTLEDVSLSRDEHFECATWLASHGAHATTDESISELLCQHVIEYMDETDETVLLEDEIGLEYGQTLEYCF